MNVNIVFGLGADYCAGTGITKMCEYDAATHKAAHFEGAVFIFDNSSVILSQKQILTTHAAPLPMAGIPLHQTGIGASLLIL